MTEFSKRLDAKGRNVTDLAGLWSEEDLIPLAEYRRLEAEVERLRAYIDGKYGKTTKEAMADELEHLRTENQRLKDELLTIYANDP